MRRPRQTLAAALLLPLLAGCGGAPQASPPPTPSASPETTAPTQNETRAPALPDSAVRPTKRSAAAFVEHYGDLVNYASATGDVKPAQSVASPDCKSCNSVTDLIARVYSSGGSSTGGEWTIEPLTASRSSSGWSINAQVDLAPQTLRQTKTAEPREFAGGRTQASFLVAFVDGAWQMQQWTRAS